MPFSENSITFIGADAPVAIDDIALAIADVISRSTGQSVNATVEHEVCKSSSGLGVGGGEIDQLTIKLELW